MTLTVALKQDSEVSAIVAKARLPIRKLMVTLRRKALRAYLTREVFDPTAQLAQTQKQIAPLLATLQTLAYMEGAKRSLLNTRQSKTPLSEGVELSTVSTTIDRLSKSFNVDTKQLHDAFQAKSLEEISGRFEYIAFDYLNELQALTLQRATKVEAVRALQAITNKGKIQLETVFRTSSATSYNAGRWQADQSPAIQEILWGYEYITVGDDRVRPEHAVFEGTRRPKDDPFWELFWPPNGWNCRCTTIAIFNDDDLASIKNPDDDRDIAELEGDIDPAFRGNPGKEIVPPEPKFL